jgi:alkaline phosphatase D
LDRIAREGLRAEAWQSSFPTITFPNHYAMATGLYPDHHGIVHNSFYNKELGLIYTMGNREVVVDGRFYKGEPIWNTAKKQGKRTANFFWVGSEANVQGMQPDIWKTYDHNISYETRIDSVLSWLQLPEETRPELIMFYFEDPDNTTHHNHPVNGEFTKAMVKRCDSLAGAFYDKMKQLPIADRIHFLIVSDHGMCPTAIERTEYLSDYIKEEWVTLSNWGNPVALFDIKEDKLDSALLMLSKAEHLSAWIPSEIPERLHYGSDPNIGNLVVVADSAYNIFKDHSRTKSNEGQHGYDNINKDLYGIFYANGRDFKKSFVAPIIPNIQLYNIICKLLDLTPAPNDGNIKDLDVLFAK